LWYDKQSLGFGSRFIEMFEQELELIERYPERYPMRKGNFREALVNIFPYIIVYSFFETEEIVAVHSIFHTSRYPGKNQEVKLLCFFLADNFIIF
jgi:hypothetical protein